MKTFVISSPPTTAPRIEPRPGARACRTGPVLFVALVGAILGAVGTGCGGGGTQDGASGESKTAMKSSAAPAAVPAAASNPASNRIDIPAPVRSNLGITFAIVERRAVERTLRVPGRFELLPTARREHRAPLSGRVELLVSQYQPVEPGTPLYRLDSAAWRSIQEQISAADSAEKQTAAKLASMQPLRAAHRQHEASLEAKVKLWQERLTQLEELRAAGGGSAAQFTEARAMLNATEAELADTMEKDAELQSRERELEAELVAARARVELLLGTAASLTGLGSAELLAEQTVDGRSQPRWRTMPLLEVRSSVAGVVERLDVTDGGFAEESALVLVTVQPDQLRFRARGLQSDLGRLRDGLPVRVVPPQGASMPLQDTVAGTLSIGMVADADERTIDLLLLPERLASWARAGVSASMEITLEGGDASLAVPLAAVARDGATPILFRRDPANPDVAIRIDADLGVSDGRWVVVHSGVMEGDQVVVDGVHQLALATAGNGGAAAGHFHADGTFHEGED